MALSDTLEDDVENLIHLTWNTRTGIQVPKSTDILLRNGAVELDATYLYADLAGSSVLAQDIKKDVTAKVIRSYLGIATRTLRYYGGAIRSFDGDRVMAIFIGDDKETNAVRAALAINWAVDKILKPKFDTKWPDLKNYWSLNHGVGVDTGMAMLVRGGVRDNNDIISIGSAPNVAAKLSSIRDAKRLNITRQVYDVMSNDVAFVDDNLSEAMWIFHNSVNVGGTFYDVLTSNYRWKP